MSDLQIIVSIVMALGVLGFFGVMRNKQRSEHYDGEVVVILNDEDGTTDLNFKFDPNSIEAGAEKVVLKVTRV